jgi:hypothetical protein
MNIIQTSGPCKIKVSETLDFLIVPREYGEHLPSDEEARKIGEAHVNVVDFIQTVMENRAAVWTFMKSLDKQPEEGQNESG